MEKKTKYWLIPNNPNRYDSINAFKDLKEIDWGNQANNKFEIGDIAYIYVSKPIQSIAIKTEVSKIDIPKDEILGNDEKYSLNHNIDDRESFVRLKFLEFTNQDNLSLQNLQENGLKQAPQSKITIKDDLLKYILKSEKIGNTMPKSTQKQALNQILYGSPGTGKTYNTINKAIEIIDSDFYQQNKYNRVALKERFEEYKKAGQIEFITFHQSFSYEEFVEGIKAETKDENISYEVKAGIFKKLCEKAMGKENNNFNEKIEWLKAECSEADNKSLHIDTFTVTYRDGKTFRIKPDKSKNSETDYPASIENIEKIYKGGLRKEVYNPTYVVGILNYLYDNGLTKYDEIKEDNTKNYILIIDEINRGNISKIFGELITLIEPSKRVGNDEEIRLKLPYSGDDFGVPSNLYIIGTMNTADRSIALMDTALRRRFHFEEMMPDSELLKDIVVDGVNIKELLETINKRIEYLYDRDHTIGHAYFMSLKDEKLKDKKSELDNIFRNKIIPLLQEYFYDDWEKIQIVLGDHINQFDSSKKETPKNFYDKNCKELSINKYRFIQSIEFKEIDVIGFNHEDIEDEQINYKVSDNFEIECYKKIYEKDAYTRIKDKVDNKTIEQNNVEGL